MFFHPASIPLPEKVINDLEKLLLNATDVPQHNVLQQLATSHKVRIQLLKFWFKGQMALKENYKLKLQSIHSSKNGRRLKHFCPITSIQLKMYQSRESLLNTASDATVYWDIINSDDETERKVELGRGKRKKFKNVRLVPIRD